MGRLAHRSHMVTPMMLHPHDALVDKDVFVDAFSHHFIIYANAT
jgi:hypothetical protein